MNQDLHPSLTAKSSLTNLGTAPLHDRYVLSNVLLTKTQRYCRQLVMIPRVVLLIIYVPGGSTTLSLTRIWFLSTVLVCMVTRATESIKFLTTHFTHVFLAFIARLGRRCHSLQWQFGRTLRQGRGGGIISGGGRSDGGSRIDVVPRG